jgi:hypothetical protein
MSIRATNTVHTTHSSLTTRTDTRATHFNPGLPRTPPLPPEQPHTYKPLKACGSGVLDPDGVLGAGNPGRPSSQADTSAPRDATLAFGSKGNPTCRMLVMAA